MSQRFARVLLLLAVAAFALSLWAALTGGSRFHILGVPVSVRGARRAMLTGLYLGLAALCVDRTLRLKILERFGRRWAVSWSVVLACGVLAAGIFLGSRSAGGADSYGYLSQAAMWQRGALDVTPQSFGAPWPDELWTVTPLGYVPAKNARIVPSYPAGLPLLMATAGKVLGGCGPYLVAPICGAFLILATCVLGLRSSTPLVAAGAATLVATSPVALMMALSNMSDVPAAAFWTAAVACSLNRRKSAASVAGLLTGVAIAIRPNLAPLAAVVGVSVAVHAAQGFWTRRLIGFTVCCVPFVALTMLLFDYWYGGPFRSGYGDLSELYSAGHVLPNIVQQAAWLSRVHTPLASAFVFSVIARDRGATLYVLLGYIACVWLAYVFYMPFSEWWYLRFLLPALPVTFILTLSTINSLSDRLGKGAPVPFIAAAVLLMTQHTTGTEFFEQAARTRENERRYVDVGSYLRQHVPSTSVVFAHQHSGSVRFHGHKPTLRYDQLDPAWLDRAVDHLRSRNYTPLVVLDRGEIPTFAKRFAGQNAVGVVQRPPLACTRSGDTCIFSFDTSSEPHATSVTIPAASGCNDLRHP